MHFPFDFFGEFLLSGEEEPKLFGVLNGFFENGRDDV
jgi:hypothetical protein